MTQNSLVKYSVLLTICIGCIVIFSSASYAQSTYGSVTGTITDASGGAIGDVHVTLTNMDTSQQLTQDTNAEGLYLFSFLLGGRLP